ncbi:MAG: nickel pincer cofactor biosynthesis protein LarC [Acidimicrobiales bacterium]|nr:nickel pincer cofactor biosynthesis protein LarC [Acidimicrobiales bacterium]
MMAVDQLWIDPSFGASGDMIIGALIDLGAPPDRVADTVRGVGIDGFSMACETVERGGLRCARATIEVPADEVAHRSWSTIDAMIGSASLPPSVSKGARQSFRRLGEVEAAIHQEPIDQVHFHEVGALDAIVDIVGAWVAWHLLGEPIVTVGTFGLGHGTVDAAHGELPLPAPAVAELLRGWPSRGVDIDMETVTPTGAAILTTMAQASSPSMPAGTISATGRGAGARNPNRHPNIVTAIFSTRADGPETTAMVELASNVDDVSAEVVAYTIERCLAEGAADAWATPILMKKGRPAHTLTVLCSGALADRLRSVLQLETGSLGVRQRIVERHAAERHNVQVEVDGHSIAVKVGPDGAKPEYEHCAAAARALDEPLRSVQARALEAFRASTEHGPGDAL